MMGNYSEGGIPGKMQWGSAWWFLDQKDGMEKQLETLSNVGLLQICWYVDRQPQFSILSKTRVL